MGLADETLELREVTRTRTTGTADDLMGPRKSMEQFLVAL